MVNVCTGTSAIAELDGADFIDLLEISRRRGDGHFWAMMQQLAARFPLDALRPVRIYPPREMLARDITDDGTWWIEERKRRQRVPMSEWPDTCTCTGLAGDGLHRCIWHDGGYNP